METIGLIGGMCWESTLPCYRTIDQTAAARLGGLHSARILLASVDLHDIEVLQRTAAWSEAGERLAEIASGLERGRTEGIDLGCAEIGLLVGREDSPVPLFDTTELHAVAAAEYSLRDGD